MKTDPWMPMRLMWMKDHQPQRLRELAVKPAELLAALDTEVQEARKVHHLNLQARTTPEVALELAMNQLCPVADRPAEFPISEKEWRRMEAMLRPESEEM